MPTSGKGSSAMKSAVPQEKNPRPCVTFPYHENLDIKCKRTLLLIAGVILESEDLHRQAYNAAFQHFDICCDGRDRVVWSSEFYDDLQV